MRAKSYPKHKYKYKTYRPKYKHQKNIITRYKYITNILSMCLISLIIIFIIHKFLFAKHKFKNFSIPEKNISAFQMSYKNLLELKDLSQKYNICFDELITIYSLENNFFPDRLANNTESLLELEKNLIINYNDLKKKYGTHLINKYKSIFKNILSEIKYFPIPDNIPPENYIFCDSWERFSNSKNKIPQGCDIFDRENISGQIPVISMTDGIITQINWDNSKGYNISIKTNNNNYYSYFHLERFADGLEKNLKITAGNLLGYMGDTQIQTQKKDAHKSVHLHICISPKTNFSLNNFYINPYLFLRLIENQKASLPQPKNK